MPHLKTTKPPPPLWREWDEKANKSGLRHVIYQPQSKDEYAGEWHSNKKHGKGTYLWKRNNTLYDGDWKFDKRNGFGTLSKRLGAGSFQKIYAGGWKNDMRHGYGTQYYTENEHYEGEWHSDKRSGWGRMHYSDGSIYEGGWFDDQRSGNGMFRLSNDNRYEGSWKYDKKNGPGKFYYLEKGQIFEGNWVDDIPKCGEMRDLNREEAKDPTEFPIPEIKLEDAELVLQQAKEGLSQVF